LQAARRSAKAPPMRIIFMGTPPFAVPTLAALVAAGHDIAAVYTQPPRPAQRGKRVQQSAVHDWAEVHGLPVRTPTSLRNAEAQAEFAALNADIAVVAAYGLILPQAVLDAPTHGCLNVHGSILPRCPAPAPVQRAILAGDVETGVTIMQMDAGLDTGGMRLVGRTPVAGKTAGELTSELADMGATLMVQVLGDLAAHPPIPQPDAGALYAPKIDKSEAQLDFYLSAVQIERAIRAFNPAPGAWFELDGERFKILAAEVVPPAEVPQAMPPGVTLDDRLTIACNPGAVRVTRIQRAGKPAMNADELLRGRPVAAGTRLT
jgi:methionyl-tRNA formyltransferase